MKQQDSDGRLELDGYMEHHLGFSMTDFLEPVSGNSPTGKSVRSNGVYQAIKDARHWDDPTLPMGVWSHELKKADWDRVREIATRALISKSKDLQLTVWLLEAEIHTKGFKGIAPSILLIRELCDTYWDTLFPEIEDNDIEYRINPIVWANDKLLPVLRMIPVTDHDGGAYTWNDYEMARRYDRIRAKFPGNNELKSEITLRQFASGVSSTGTQFLAELASDIEGALLAVSSLSETLDGICGDDSPGMAPISQLLDEIKAMAASELTKRGVRFDGMGQPDSPAGGENHGEASGETDSGEGGGSGGGGGPVQSRSEAYAKLAEAAEYLAGLEPHSPVPYLVRRAIEWGNLNTAELYHELFVKCQGNLNIFELLGIDIQENQ